MYNIRNLIYPLVIGAVLGACSDDKTEYQPAEPESADCIGVYFDENNQQDFIFVPGREATVNVLMHRLNTSGAVDVPIIGKASAEGIVFPESAHFDAGSADAEIVIDCSNMPLGKKVIFSVDVPDQYINHYAATLFNYQTSALVSQWEPANTDGSPVTFYFTSQDYSGSEASIKSAVYQPVESRMEVLPGAGMFKVYNFLNCGVDIEFKLTASPFEDFQDRYRVFPADNYYLLSEAYESDDYGDPWYNAWFVYDDIEDDYVECELTTLDGESTVLDYPYLYAYSNSELFEYSYLTPKGTGRYNTVSMGLSGTPDGVTLPSYFYVFFRWDGNSDI